MCFNMDIPHQICAPDPIPFSFLACSGPCYSWHARALSNALFEQVLKMLSLLRHHVRDIGGASPPCQAIMTFSKCRTAKSCDTLRQTQLGDGSPRSLRSLEV